MVETRMHGSDRNGSHKNELISKSQYTQVDTEDMRMRAFNITNNINIFFFKLQ
jgi:hypothetical protein